MCRHRSGTGRRHHRNPHHLVWALQDADKAADVRGRADALAWGLTVAVEAVTTAARRVLLAPGEDVPQGAPEDGMLVDILGFATRAVPHVVEDGHLLIRPALSPRLRGVLLSVADALDAREAGADLRYQADLEEHATPLQAGLRGAWISWLVTLGAPTSLAAAPEDAPDHVDPAEQALRRRVERLRKMGMTAESIIADLLLYARTLDRMREAVGLGLLRAGDGTAWTRAELLHAISFAMRTAHLSAEGVRNLFTNALREVLQRRASGSNAIALGVEDLAREILRFRCTRSQDDDPAMRDYHRHRLELPQRELGTAWNDELRVEGLAFVTEMRPRSYAAVSNPFAGWLAYRLQDGERALWDRHRRAFEAHAAALRETHVELLRDLLALRWPDAAGRSTSEGRLRELGLPAPPARDDYNL